MQSSTPTGQFSHSNHSVHALKPLTKILSSGPRARKPIKASRWVPAQAWSIDVKYRCLGLIGAETADFGKGGGIKAWAAVLAVFSPRERRTQPSFLPLSRNFCRPCLP